MSKTATAIEGKTMVGYCGVFEMPLVARHEQFHAWQMPTGGVVITEGEHGRTIARTSKATGCGAIELTVWATEGAKGKGGMSHATSIEGVLEAIVKVAARA